MHFFGQGSASSWRRFQLHPLLREWIHHENLPKVTCYQETRKHGTHQTGKPPENHRLKNRFHGSQEGILQKNMWFFWASDRTLPTKNEINVFTLHKKAWKTKKQTFWKVPQGMGYFVSSPQGCQSQHKTFRFLVSKLPFWGSTSPVTKKLIYTAKWARKITPSLKRNQL